MIKIRVKFRLKPLTWDMSNVVFCPSKSKMAATSIHQQKPRGVGAVPVLERYCWIWFEINISNRCRDRIDFEILWQWIQDGHQMSWEPNFILHILGSWRCLCGVWSWCSNQLKSRSAHANSRWRWQRNRGDNIAPCLFKRGCNFLNNVDTVVSLYYHNANTPLYIIR